MAVNRRFRDFLKAEDELWRRQCQAVFSVSTPTGPEQRALNSYRDACGRWHLLCRRYGSHALRTIAAWNAIKAWLDEHIPEIASSLRPGASEEELDAAEHQLGVTLPPALRVLYRIHDGQDLQFDRHIDNQRPSMGPSVFHGLFGG